MNPTRSGGRLLVDCLKAHGVDHVFCVPGESYLAALDAFHDTPEIKLIVCRQEGGAAMMADAYGKLTGKAGVCFVTRGPGATNASAGVHVAFQDSTPMLLLVGQVARDAAEREAFQEIDYRRMFGPMAKWVAQIDQAGRIPELLGRAFHTACNGRPGPVVLALPEDMLEDETDAAIGDPYRAVEAHPSADQLQRLQDLLAGTERPLAIVGGSGWDREACAAMQSFAERFDLPVAAAFRFQDHIDNDHPNYVGDVRNAMSPKLAEHIRDSDLLLIIGARLGEMTTRGYTLIEVPRPRQTFVHVYPDIGELGRVYQTDLAINAGNKSFLHALGNLHPAAPPRRSAWTRQARAGYERWSTPDDEVGAVRLGEIVVWLRDHLESDAIVTNGAGNSTFWLHRFFRYRPHATQLAPTAGSMGYGFPAAVAASILYPDRSVVAWVGDGCFQMTLQELGTAVQYDAKPIVIVVNNAMLGSIRMHQERQYPGRVTGSQLVNPDFTALARAYGVHGECVDANEQFADAFQRAQESGKPAVIELRVGSTDLTPR